MIIIPNEILQRKGLNLSEKIIWSVFSHTEKEQRMTQLEISKKTGICRRQVQTSIHSLQRKGVLKSRTENKKTYYQTKEVFKCQD